jgi:hypothetical protein
VEALIDLAEKLRLIEDRLPLDGDGSDVQEADTP